VPQAILFDLDETLTDRTRSIFQYAQRFRGDFVDHLASTPVSTIAVAHDLSTLVSDAEVHRGRMQVDARAERMLLGVATHTVFSSPLLASSTTPPSARSRRQPAAAHLNEHLGWGIEVQPIESFEQP
jgi:phosphoglycolate phosphatase-like HAD superfamily hydrolase